MSAISPRTPISADLSCERFAERLSALGSPLEGWLALLLAVDFANRRHPFFDLSQHAQVGSACVH
jgi:hypothetical protein